MRLVRFLHGWLIRHFQVALSTLGQLTRAPVGTLMTSAVIGIALALPAGLYLLLDNARALSEDWGGGTRLSVFLDTDLSDADTRRITRAISEMPDVAHAHLITAREALEEYREMSGFGAALKTLERNPLPAVVVVEPVSNRARPERLSILVDTLAARDGVDIAQLDLQWVQRLTAILGIVQRGVVILAILLALAVLLIIGNTIRLGIQNRREEIEITRLFGATDAFIRRPFLYTGLWYGWFGALLAWLLVSTAFGLLDGPVRQLADLYYSDFLLHGMDGTATLVLMATGVGLGLAGSWVAVGRHLRDIVPG